MFADPQRLNPGNITIVKKHRHADGSRSSDSRAAAPLNCDTAVFKRGAGSNTSIAKNAMKR